MWVLKVNVCSEHQTERLTRGDVSCHFSHSLSKHPSTDWEDTGDTERDWPHGGYLSRAQSYTSLQVSSWREAHYFHSSVVILCSYTMTVQN